MSPTNQTFDVVFYSPTIGPLLSARLDRPTGGAETQIYLLTQALSDRGWRVAIVVHDGAGIPEWAGGVRVIRQRAVATNRPLLRSLDYLAALAGALLPLRTDVTVQRAAGTTTGMVGLLSGLGRSRFVYSSANVIDFSYHRLEPKRRNVRLYELGVRLADRIVVQNEEQETLCRQRFSRSPVVIKSIAEPAPARQETPDAFLWVGRLTHYKRPLDYVALARAVPEAHFRMVGVPVLDEGRRLMAQIGVATADLPNFELLAPRPRAELSPLIERAVAMVNTAEYEGMPNIYLESWSRGVPALGLHHDPDGVIVREGLGGFAGGSAERFAELARSMWSGRVDQAELAGRCRRYIDRDHSPEAVVTAWEAALGLRRRHPSRQSWVRRARTSTLP